MVQYNCLQRNKSKIKQRGAAYKFYLYKVDTKGYRI